MDQKFVMPLILALAILVTLGLLAGGAGAAALFGDDFEDGNSSGWSTSNGSWSVVTDGSKVYKQSGTSTTAHAYNGTAGWTAYSVQARAKALSFNGSGRYFGILARYQSSSNYYLLALSNAGTLEICKKVGGTVTVLASKTYSVATGTWYTLKLTVNGSSLQGYVNGALELSATDSSLIAGKIGCTAYYASAEFDDIRVDDLSGTATPTPSSATLTPTPSSATPTPTPTPSGVTPTPTPSNATPTPTPGGATPTPSATTPVSGTIVVAKDGSGNFTTIQAALDSIPAGNRAWVTIAVKNGTYNEHVFIAKSYIALIGEDRENTRVELALDRAAWNSEMGVTNTGSGVINIGCTAPDSAKVMTKVDTTDILIGNLTVSNTAAVGSSTVYTHAIRGESTATRISLVSSNVYGMGSDPLALWNTATGMYYHADCTFKGKIDAVCPRGWCYDIGSTYIEVGNSAPIWHEGAAGSGQKFVIRNAYVMPDAPKNFKLLNGQKESTVYLLDSYFYNSGGKTISAGSVYAAYFYNCHMEGGDQSWHADNLSSAPNAPTQSQITAKWTFNNEWDPENTLPAVLPFASIPQPWHQADDVSNVVQLKWVKARGAYSYNIYFGTTSSPTYAGNTPANTYNPGTLAPGTTYYWRVDAVTQNGIVTGPVWSFTVSGN
jgi:hypothetical protein